MTSKQLDLFGGELPSYPIFGNRELGVRCTKCGYLHQITGSRPELEHDAATEQPDQPSENETA